MAFSNKWKKRITKIKGFFTFMRSVLLMRYTPWHANVLRKEIEQSLVDKLHVGCGKVILKDWLNIFYENYEEYGRIKNNQGRAVLNYNLSHQWPFPDHSISFIAGSHFIEHLDLNKGIEFLKKGYRVLKKGGVIHLSCPDLELYAHHYVKNNKKFFEHELIREWCTFQNAITPGEVFIAKAYDSGGAHQWFYDFESLKHILELVGFEQIKRCRRLEGKTPDLDIIDFPERELETLYVEAVKP